MHPNYQLLTARLSAASRRSPILSNRPGVSAWAFGGEQVEVTD